MNLMMLLEMAASGFSDRVAFTNGTDALTYTALYDAAGQAASQLRNGNDAHLAMLDVSSLALPVALFAAAWAGKPFVPINYRLSDAEIDALLERIAPCTLVTDAAHVAKLADREGVTCIESEAFLQAARGGQQSVAPDWSMEQEDTAVLLFTSGTTGAPKAAVLRHRHLVSYLLSSVEFGSAADDEVILVTVPPYHIAGVVSVISAVYAGRKVVQLASFNARRWIELARAERVTNAFLVPTMLRDVVAELDAQGQEGIPSLRALAYGGGKMPRAVIERAMQLLPQVEFTQAYGLTETSSTVCVLRPNAHRAALVSDDPAIQRRLTSVGQALPGIELQIRDAQGRALASGERGEIYVRGEQVSGEYVGKGSLLDDAGWFATRDAGELDDEGFLFLEGRADDVIVRGAENMSPGEIEDVLLSHAAVADAAVVGVADEQWGEAVAAVVVLEPAVEVDAQELRNWVKAHLRSSRVPRDVFFAEQLPYNETGKLLRRVVREQLATAGDVC